MKILKIVMTSSQYCHSCCSICAILIPDGALQVTHSGLRSCCCIDELNGKNKKNCISKLISIQVGSRMACVYLHHSVHICSMLFSIWYLHFSRLYEEFITHSLVSILVSCSPHIRDLYQLHSRLGTLLIFL